MMVIIHEHLLVDLTITKCICCFAIYLLICSTEENILQIGNKLTEFHFWMNCIVALLLNVYHFDKLKYKQINNIKTNCFLCTGC